MITQSNRDKAVDDLLRVALADDLAADVAAAMRERIGRFRAGTAGERSPAAAWAWLRRRTVWAALSAMMLVAGILLQGARASSPLADRISAIKTANLSLEHLRR